MMEPHAVNAALEGPCCAGKTTLGRGLMEALADVQPAFVRDYSDHVGGGRFLPPPVPLSLAEEEVALAEFIRIEGERVEHARSPETALILIDRSVHTLVSHCAALEQVSGIEFSTVAERMLAESAVPLWPHAVFYLDTPAETIDERNRGKFSAGSIFVNRQFNAGIRSYFSQLVAAGTPDMLWLDATLDPLTLRRQAELYVRELLHRRQSGTVAS